MCDTLGKLGKDRSFFAKNSDRSPNEIQILEYHGSKQGLSGNVDCTYISIPQAQETYAVLLSRPVWMWGAEMGINEFGLCIGNEAVFTKGAYGKTGLTGMDMVRLALERSRTAKDALELLISLLETYGQGGNCGFDHDFYYVNVFLLVVASDIVNLSDSSLVDNQIDCLAVILNIQPVTHIFAFAVNRQRLVGECICNHQRNQLFREVIRSIVV